MIETSRLPSGTLIVTDQVPGSRSVAFGCWFGVGSRDEPADRAGLCHLVEHLVFKGTEQRSGREIASAVERVGGELDAFTSRELTVVHGRFPARTGTLGPELAAELVTQARFDAADLDIEREVVFEEMAAARDQPDDECLQLLYERCFEGHPLARDVLGREQTLAAIAVDDVRAFIDRELRADRLVAVASGAVDHASLVAAMEAPFGSATPTAAPVRVEPGHASGGCHRYERPGEQSHLAMAWPAPGARHPDRAAAAVLAHVLGGGAASRLFWSVRERRGLAYAVGAHPVTFTDAGMLVVTASTRPEHTEELIELVGTECRSLVEQGIEADELADALGYVTGSLEIALEDPSARAGVMAATLLERGEPFDLDAELAELAAVEADRLIAVAEQVLGNEPVMVVVEPG